MAAAVGLAGAIYYILANAAGVTALVSTRISAQRLPQDITFPALSFQVISGVRDHYQASDGGVVYGGFQVSCWHQENYYAVCASIAAAVRAALSRYSDTANGVVIHDIRLENEIHRWHPDIYESGLHEILLDFVAYYKE